MYSLIISFFNLDKQVHGSYISQCHPGLLAIFLFFFFWYRFGFIFLNLACWFGETVCLYFWFGLFSIEWLGFQYTFFLFLTICLWSYILITFANFSEYYRKRIYIKLGWEEKCLVRNSTFFGFSCSICTLKK